MRLEILERIPSPPSHTTPVLFVHGAFFGAWCWERFLSYFAQHGYASYAVSLRGHGHSDGELRTASMRDYAEDVAAAAAQLPSPPVLIGHSMGGRLTQKVLETHPETPGAVLLAPIPNAGFVAMTFRFLRQMPGPFLRSLLKNSPYELIKTPGLARERFFSASMPDEELNGYFEQLQQESTRAERDTFSYLPKPEHITSPMLLLAATRDTMTTAQEQRVIAKAYGVEAEFFDMAHAMMLEPGWQAVAERILHWLSTLGL
jgi:pimeloyl-ACP methyl ester carboxylesterase